MSQSIPTDYPKTAMGRNGIVMKSPSVLIELSYFILLIYANLGPAYGVAIPLVGAGGLAGLAVLCIMHFGSNALLGAVRPIRFALACGLFVLLIQGFIFEESFRNGFIRSYVTWILSLIIIQALSFRKGFFHRFALVAFFIGCATLPFLKTYVVTEGMERIGGDEGVALGNPNYFGMWFGFCTIYFLVTGLEAKNYIIRTSSWIAGVLCLYLMALTVSRGALLGVAIALVIAFEKLLKRSFLPILGFLCLLWLVFVSGIFDDLIGFYMYRGTEETGRSRLWSWAMAGILDSWGLGVGMSNAVISDGSTGRGYGPHNSFLFIALSSGLIPLTFYILYLIQAGRGALRARSQNTTEAPYKLPLFSFALLAVMVADGTFMSPWHMVVFSLAIGSAIHGSRRKSFGQSPTVYFSRRTLKN